MKLTSALPLRVGVPSIDSEETGKVPTDVSPTKTSTSVLSGAPSEVRSTSETVKETSSPSVSSLGASLTAMACLRKSGSTTSRAEK